MHKFKIDDIRYMPNSVVSAYGSKEHAYLYCIMKHEKYPDIPINHIIKHEPEPDIPQGEIVNAFISFVTSIKKVTKACDYLEFVDNFNDKYENNSIGLIKLNYDGIIKPIKFTVKKIHFNKFTSLPDRNIVWEFHRISPPLAGMLFENMLADILHLSSECYDLSNCFKSENTKSSITELTNLLNTRFLEQLFYATVQGGFMIKVNTSDDTQEEIKLDECHFKSKWHYIIFLALKHFMLKELTGEDVENCISMIELIESSKFNKLISNYYDDLSKSKLVHTLNNAKCIKYGVKYNYGTLTGIVDFITDDAIIDVKVHRENEHTSWANQLWQYNYLYNKCENNNKRLKLKIINLYSNEIFEYTEHDC